MEETIPEYIDDSAFCGQTTVKNRVNFYIHSAKSGGIFPALLIADKRGSGKSKLARLIANRLSESTPNRVAYEINGAEIKNLDSFVNSIIIPKIQGQNTVLFLDEAETISIDVLNWLLSVVCPNKNNKAIVRYQDSEIEFDYRNFSLLLATTNQEKLRLALLSRLTRIEFETYKNEDLIHILHKNSDFVTYKDNVEEQIVEICRESPRSVVKLVTDGIKGYCKIKQQTKFGIEDWNSLKKQHGIRPLGLQSNEIEILRLLSSRGSMSLTGLAASMGLDTSTVRKDIELFLLKRNLIKIEGKRHITAFGQQILKEIG